MTESITPFSIDVSAEQLDDLHRRLDMTRLGTVLPGDGWDTGVPRAYLDELIAYWRDDYDWRAAERALNAYPQFRSEIDGTPIHFVHVQSDQPDALPLILTHGWPGSFLEFLDLVGPLTDPTRHGGSPDDAFHVIIPSLPGFGLSSPLAGAGWDSNRIAGTWVELMDRLGYERFGVQGGDIGASVSPAVGRSAPDRVVGVHVNGSLGMPVDEFNEDELAALTDLERDRVDRVRTFMRDEYGYIAIQSTRPATIGAALADSPAGLLAWIVDKFAAWTHPPDARPDNVIGRDRLLTNVMLYWLTATATSAAYVGYAQASWGPPPKPSCVPTGAIMFAHDVGIRRVAERTDTISMWTDVPDRGGHFAALEEPGLLVDNMRTFFREYRA